MTALKGLYKAIEEHDFEKFTKIIKTNTVDLIEHNNILMASCRSYSRIHYLNIRSTDNAFNIINFLINSMEVDPSENYNLCIKTYCTDKKLTLLLWNNKKVKETLKEDYFQLYEALTKMDLNKKISNF